LSVALAFNVKPESSTFSESVSSHLNNTSEKQSNLIDQYAEWDTWETINAVKDALSIYHDVTLIEADQNAFEKFKSLRPDIVFNIAEGLKGVSRESQIPAMLEMLDIPFTGSDSLTLGICLDKSRTKEILSYYNIPNSKFYIYENSSQLNGTQFNFPLFVKPVCEGSSKGIFASSITNNLSELQAEVERVTELYNQPALVEEFLPGREFTVALLGNGSETKVLPIIEVRFDKFPENVKPVYSYETKWILDTKENDFDVFDCPANLDEELKEKIIDVCLRTYMVLRCRDWSRIDLRLDRNGIPNVIEINPLPGIMPDPRENSGFPKAARAAGMSYDEMINQVLLSACKRYNLL
jgi:D-alanine-D-alanine ligase